MSPVIHAAACQEALARLPKLDRDELRQQWRALYKAEASPHLSRELLVRAVAYRMQELTLGGLRAAPQRQLRHFAQQLKANAEVPDTSRSRAEVRNSAAAGMARPNL